MSPFQEFRLWARRAPVGERATAGVAALVAVALLVWLLVPSTDEQERVATADGTVTDSFDATSPDDRDTVDDDAGAPSSTAGDGSTDGSGASSSTAATVDAGSSGGSASGSPDDGSGAGSPDDGTPDDGGNGGQRPSDDGCTSPPGGASGVSDSQIEIAVVTVEIVGPAANEIFGIPHPDEQEAAARAVIDGVNDRGGVACRQLVPQFYRGNPADRSSLQGLCLDIVESGAYVVIDIGAYAAFPQKQCFAQHQVPYFGGYFLGAQEQAEFYPYLFNAALLETLHTNTYLALDQQGFFDAENGFDKLGFVHQDCNPSMIDNARDALTEVGITGDKIMAKNLGCPETFASPVDIQQAVFDFKRAGVTHVTFVNAVGDIARFTEFAESQEYRPVYGFPDEALISISYGSQAPNYDQLAGAWAITQMRQGEETTPGVSPTVGTQRCNEIMTGAGLQPVYERPAAVGRLCNQVWMFQAAMEHAPTIEREALAVGLQTAGSIDMSFPDGPVDWTAERTTTGGQFWRTARFRSECDCWQVPSTDFHQSFR